MARRSPSGFFVHGTYWHLTVTMTFSSHSHHSQWQSCWQADKRSALPSKCSGRMMLRTRKHSCRTGLPSCRIRLCHSFSFPAWASDFQQAVRTLARCSTSFAVVFGGHPSDTGVLDIDSGVTIDLSAFLEATLVDNPSAAWLGPGTHRREVYNVLEAQHVVVSRRTGCAAWR